MIGTSIQTAENEATFILSDPELNSAILGCFLTDPEFYSGLVLQTETPVGPLPVVNYNLGQVGPEPAFAFGPVMGADPSTGEFVVRWLPS